MKSSRQKSSLRAFTLVELMVAITGGLFVSIIVFTIAKNSARFYQAETRVGEATLGGMVGFDRLRADIARAGFLSSANIQSDPRVCGGPPGTAGFPTLLQTLTSIQITSGATDSIVLAGSYSSVDYFPIRVFLQKGSGAGPSLILAPNSLAMQRLGIGADAGAQVVEDILTQSVFKPGRAVRIVDRSDRHYYAVIEEVDTSSGEPEVRLLANPPIQAQGAGNFCGIDQCTGCVVNVVNFIRYDVAKLSGTGYAPLYSEAGAVPYDDVRTELRRVELDLTNNPIAGTEELVAQYAVDLKFGLLVEQVNAGVRGLNTLDFGNTAIATFAAAPPATAQLIRGVRVRLGVRTRDADRETNIDSDAGLYRVKLDDNHFARVRTLQADVMLNNVTSLSW